MLKRHSSETWDNSSTQLSIFKLQFSTSAPMLRPGYPSSRAEPRSDVLPGSFSLTYRYDQNDPLKGKLDRQLLCNKPVDLTWLLNVRRYSDTITINSVEIDSAQDLLLLLHYDQPRSVSHNQNATIKVFPVQLSNPTVRPSRRSKTMTNAHQHACKPEIVVLFEPDDEPDGGPTDTLEIEMTLCGDYFALFFRYTKNQRVSIWNWKTGMEVAVRIPLIDSSHSLLTKAASEDRQQPLAHRRPHIIEHRPSW